MPVPADHILYIHIGGINCGNSAGTANKKERYKQMEMLSESVNELKKILSSERLINGMASERAAYIKETEQKVGKKMREKTEEIKGLLFSDSFQGIMDNISRLYDKAVVFSGRDVFFLGKKVEGFSFDYSNCLSMAGQCIDRLKKLISTLLDKDIYVKYYRGDENKINAALKNLSMNYAALVSFTENSGRLKEDIVKNIILQYDERVDAVKKSHEISDAAESLKRVKESIRTSLGRVYGLKYVKERIKSGGDKTRPAADEIPLGFASVPLEKEIVRYVTDEILSDKTGVSAEDLQCDLLTLNADSDRSAAFIELDRTYEGRPDGFYICLKKIVAGALLNFRPKDIEFAFIEDSNGGDRSRDGIYSLLGALRGEIEKISPDLVFHAEERTSESRRKACKLIEELDREYERREKELIQTRCRNIGEYNKKNPNNPFPCILLMIHGYSSFFEGSDFRYYAGMKKLITSGGKVGILTLMFGQKECVGDIGYKKEKLNPEELGMLRISVGEDGNGVYKDRGFDIKSLCSDMTEMDEIGTFIRSEIEKATRFYLDDIIETEAKENFEDKISIPIGMKGSDKYYHETSTENPPYPFTLVTGGTGSGKSAFLHMFIMSGAMKYAPDELEFYVIDFKSDGNNEFTGYVKRENEENLYVPHVKYISSKCYPENALDIINYLEMIMKERNEKGKFREYNRRPEVKSGKMPKMPMIYVIIDEYARMFGDKADEDAEIWERIRDKWTSFIKRARTSGIGVIFCGQESKSMEKDALAQISNRIAFQNPSAELRNMFGDWDESDYRFPVKNYQGCAYCVVSYNDRPKSVNMAFCGDPDSKMLHDIARRIREKYKDYKCEQIIIGNEAAAEIAREHAYMTWDEEARFAAGLISAEGTENGNADKNRIAAYKTNLANNKPLTIGLSSAFSVPIKLEFTCNANEINYFACANVNVLYRLEQNAAFAFLFQTADLAYNEPRIIYMAENNGVTDGGYAQCFAGFAEKYPFLRDCIEYIENPQDMARKLFELQYNLKSHSPDKPYLVIMHEIRWFRDRDRNVWMPDDDEAFIGTDKVPSPVSSGKKTVIEDRPDYSEYLDGLKACLKNDDEDLMKIKGDLLSDGNDDAYGEDIPEDEENIVRFNASKVRDAFRRLYTEGNANGVFMLVDSADYRRGIHDIVTDDDEIRELAPQNHSVFGSFEECKKKEADNGGDADSCFLTPSGLKSKGLTYSASGKTRLFDYSVDNAASWWSALEERLNKTSGRNL